MELYLAKIEGTSTPDDFRISVRILPDMENIADIAELPRFPNFFGNKGYTGKLDELVWVVSNKEFTMGYVLGLVSKFNWEGDYETQSISTESFEKIRNIYVELKGVLLPFSDLEITYWDNTCIHAIDRRDGKTIIGYSSGSVSVIGPAETTFVVGNTDTGNQSILEVLEDRISLSANSIYLNGENVYLGRNSYGPVVVTSGTDINTAVASKGVYA